MDYRDGIWIKVGAEVGPSRKRMEPAAKRKGKRRKNGERKT